MEEEEKHGSRFNDRVDKIFGSISSESKSLWSLRDAQIERRVWNKSDGGKRDDDQTPLSSSFDNHNDEDWDIRSSIGLDSTLDNEDEEDEYDKIAQGKEDDDDRLYMKDVTHHGPYLNHDDQHMLNADGITIKSILKRKTHEMPKPAKRVRFHPTCKTTDELQPQVSQDNRVPDYIQNPSNYTRYDFHDNSLDDVSERSNTDVYLGFMDQLKKSKHVADDQSSAVLPKSVLFIPRKKPGDAAAACNSVNQQQQSTAIGIAALELQQQEGGEISEMQQTEEKESHVCTKPRFQTPGRQYRSKMEEDDTVC